MTARELPPAELCEYDPARWERAVEVDEWGSRELRGSEAWRRAQDAWSQQHGIDRAEFEERRNLMKGRLRAERAREYTAHQHQRAASADHQPEDEQPAPRDPAPCRRDSDGIHPGLLY